MKNIKKYVLFFLGSLFFSSYSNAVLERSVKDLLRQRFALCVSILRECDLYKDEYSVLTPRRFETFLSSIEDSIWGKDLMLEYYNLLKNFDFKTKMRSDFIALAEICAKFDDQSLFACKYFGGKFMATHNRDFKQAITILKALRKLNFRVFDAAADIYEASYSQGFALEDCKSNLSRWRIAAMLRKR